MTINNEGIERLQHAIVLQAAKDYKRALKYDDTEKIKSLERWFSSEFGLALTDNKSDYILQEIRKGTELRGKI